jgi:hypothetical protein
MIHPVAQVAVEHGHKHVGETFLAIGAGSGLAGMTIGQINEWLQAGAFIVSMIAGLCAAFYYVKKTRSDK